MLLASKNFSIERLSHDDYDLRVSFNCLHCGFTSICDLYKVSLERCLAEHLQKCPKAGAQVAVASPVVQDSPSH